MRSGDVTLIVQLKLLSLDLIISGTYLLFNKLKKFSSTSILVVSPIFKIQLCLSLTVFDLQKDTTKMAPAGKSWEERLYFIHFIICLLAHSHTPMLKPRVGSQSIFMKYFASPTYLEQLLVTV